MGHSQRIHMAAIQEMKKILDALPDKNIGKTKEEALSLLNAHIQKAYAKGYSVKELAGIMTKGSVAVSVPTLREHSCAASPRTKKAKPLVETVKKELKIGNLNPARKSESEPSYYTPDIPDTEL